MLARHGLRFSCGLEITKDKHAFSSQARPVALKPIRIDVLHPRNPIAAPENRSGIATTTGAHRSGETIALHGAGTGEESFAHLDTP
jgi:hypothetical protein